MHFDLFKDLTSYSTGKESPRRMPTERPPNSNAHGNPNATPYLLTFIDKISYLTHKKRGPNLKYAILHISSNGSLTRGKID
jgi:hypothetical protein